MTRVLAMLLSCVVGVAIGFALATRPGTLVSARAVDVARIDGSSRGDVAPGAALSRAAVAPVVAAPSAAPARDADVVGVPPAVAQPAGGGSPVAHRGRSRVERAGSALLDALSAGPSERSAAPAEEPSPPPDADATQAIARDDARVAVAAMLEGFDAALPHGPDGAHEPSPPPLPEGDE